MLVTETCGYAMHVKNADAGIVSAEPFNQEVFNQQWLEMRQALDLANKPKPKWSKNGLAYTKKIMQDNDGSAEANILIQLAEIKNANKAGQ